jgi:hypothetical protein
MIYKFLPTNVWLNLNMSGQDIKEAIYNWMFPDVNGVIYNSINKMLGNDSVPPQD